MAADFLLLVAPPRKIEPNSNHNISAVSHGGYDGNGDEHGGFQNVKKGSTGVELRYYKKGN